MTANQNSKLTKRPSANQGGEEPIHLLPQNSPKAGPYRGEASADALKVIRFDHLAPVETLVYSANENVNFSLNQTALRALCFFFNQIGT